MSIRKFCTTEFSPEPKDEFFVYTPLKAITGLNIIVPIECNIQFNTYLSREK